MPALPADPIAPAVWIALFSMSTGWPASPTARIASLTLPWNVFLSAGLGPPIFRPVVGGPLLRKSARMPWLPLLGPLQTPVGQPKVVAVTASGVPSERTPSAKVGPMALPLMTRELPFVMWTPVVAYRMAALVIVLRVALRRAVSVAEPTRSMPPQSPAGMIEGHDCTKTDGQLWMLTLSRKLVKTFVPGFTVSLASRAAPLRLIVPFDLTTLPPGTKSFPVLRVRLPSRR